MRREDPHWHTVPTPSHTRPYAVPLARWIEPRCATRCQERKLQEWRLDCRGDQGTQMAAVSRTVVCQDRNKRMTNKTNNSLTPVVHQPGNLPARTNNSLTPVAPQPGRPPVRVKLRRVNANLATPKCGARTRTGTPCQRPPIRGRTRCRLHGGLSPGAPRGAKNGNFRNGDWTAEAIEERKWLRSLVQSFAKTGTT